MKGGASSGGIGVHDSPPAPAPAPGLLAQLARLASLSVCTLVHQAAPYYPALRHPAHVLSALYLLAHTGSPKFSVTYGRVKADFVKYIKVTFTLSLDIRTKLCDAMCVSFVAHISTYAIHQLGDILFNSHRRGTKQSLGN